ncbi:DUF397 domain-containing protein [Streptomyces sp. NBC_00669]|uniref:DUF397 domain-containing protein n=1 Tax=Streptomyces sp. NBC_00669 TaxID=2976011 RepID=UPI002E359ECB|nr:DUF397 domain-containing protein [Streptomyces sp. NBC_00669]
MTTARDLGPSVEWRKSSYSNGSGGECVEIGWRKSSYSNGSGGDCVEVGDGDSAVLPVRDSKDPEGPVLTFTPTAWTSFIGALKSGALPIG